jgi:hypothetical protein
MTFSRLQNVRLGSRLACGSNLTRRPFGVRPTVRCGAKRPFREPAQQGYNAAEAEMHLERVVVLTAKDALLRTQARPKVFVSSGLCSGDCLWKVWCRLDGREPQRPGPLDNPLSASLTRQLTH